MAPSATLKDAGRVFAAAAKRWDDVEGFRLGAAFSFYATFSIFPLLLLTVTGVGFLIGGEGPARAHLLDTLAGPATPIRHVLDSAIDAMEASRSARGPSAVIGIATLLFSASGAFVELRFALDRIWGAPERKSSGIARAVRVWVVDRLVGLAIVGGIGLTCLASLVVGSALGAMADRVPALLRAAEASVSVAILSLAIAIAFRYVPRAPTRPRLGEVIGGAVLTTTLLAATKTLFAGYLAGITSYSAYGIAGGVLAVAFFIYLSSQIILFGACVTYAASLTPSGATTREPSSAREGRAQRTGA